MTGFTATYNTDDLQPLVVDTAVKTGVQFNNQATLIGFGLVVLLLIAIYYKVANSTRR